MQKHQQTAAWVTNRMFIMSKMPMHAVVSASELGTAGCPLISRISPGQGMSKAANI